LFAPDEGQWRELAPGVAAKILFADLQHQRTTMLVRMTAGSQFAGHRHGGAEELFVLEGDCLCQGQSLHAGDYHRAAGGTRHGVTSTENGCLMLVISPEIEVV
jgi:anti-sigma factor ChrR (cupin superfamily)